jgi:pimeloyl-ACP methyl ester carboxylesterase
MNALGRFSLRTTLKEISRPRVIFFAIAAAIAFLSMPNSVDATHCTGEWAFASNNGYFFEAYESREYVGGLLRVHFQLKPTYNDGREWLLTLIPADDECGQASTKTYTRKISVPAGTRNFSIRFSSSTHFDVWSDDTDTKITCAECSTDIDLYPYYYEVQFGGLIDGGASSVRSAAARVTSSVTAPPQQGSSLPLPASCVASTASGHFFDSYEWTEYVNGLLRYHFRLRTPFNDGREWSAEFLFHNSACDEFSSSPPVILAFPPYVRYYSVRFISSSQYEVWNDETEERIDCTGCSGDLAAFPDYAIAHFVSFSGSVPGSSMRSTSFRVRSEPNPVIIIPGIMGSERKNGMWVIDPILHSYDDLIETLDANGYTPGVDLFTFPYDWRQSNVTSAAQLRDKIDQVQAICGCDTVDLVAHSMGGLVARYYIQSDLYENDVDQLIFLGTPHLGAPKAYLIWEGGENDVLGRDQIVKFIFSREAKELGFTSLFDYVRNYPITSVEQLLPIRDYLKNDWDGVIRSYPDGYPRNEFLEDLDVATQLLFDRGVLITDVFGDNGAGNTIERIRVVPPPQPPLWEHGYPVNFTSEDSDRGLERGAGDRTVPLESAKLPEYFFSKHWRMITDEHGNLPTSGEGTVYKQLIGKTAETLIDKFRFPNFKLLIIKILSPVDVLVTAPDGKRTGKNFATGEEYNEIEDAFYSGFETDNELVTILNPLDGEYKVKALGTGEGGEYTVSVGYISDEELIERDYTAETVSNQETDLNLLIDNANPENTSIEAASPDDGGEEQITFEQAIQDVVDAYAVGDITDKKVAKKLKNKLNKFWKLDTLNQRLDDEPGNEGRIRRNQNKIRKVLQGGLVLLEQQHGISINDEAYNLLKTDFESLLVKFSS